MIAAHTPGPWRATLAPDIVGGDGELIARVYRRATDDARLIAAAPDLLAALIEAQAMLRELEAPAHLPEADDLDLRISEAIAKARGEE